MHFSTHTFIHAYTHTYAFTPIHISTHKVYELNATHTTQLRTARETTNTAVRERVLAEKGEERWKTRCVECVSVECM
jgi:hypothetical protein